MDKRYKFAANGKTYFKNVSPDNEQKFFDLYGKYNPVLVPNEPSKSTQETDQSQQNQKKNKKGKIARGIIGSAARTMLGPGLGDIALARLTRTKEYKDSNEKLTIIEKIPGVERGWLNSFVGDIYRSGKSGVIQNSTLSPSLQYFEEGAKMSDKDLLELVERGRDMENAPMTDEMTEFNDRYAELIKSSQELMPGDEEGLSGFGGSTLAFMRGWWENPEVMAQYSAQSLANMAWSASQNKMQVLKGAIAGGVALGTTGAAATAIGGPLGSAVGGLVGFGTGVIAGALGATSRTMEMGFTTADLVREQATKSGLNWAEMSDQERVDWYKKVANDEEMFDDLTDKALRRGNTIGLIDGITGVAVPGGSRLINKRIATSRFSRTTKAAEVGTAATIETTGGMASEYYGQKAAGQEINAQEILIEGFADKTFTGIQIARGLTTGRPKYKINGQELNGRDFDRALRIMDDATYMAADIVVENSPTVKKVVTDRTNGIVVDQSVDSRVSDVNDRSELIKLETRKIELKGTNNEIELSQIEEKIKEIKSKYKDSKVDISIEDRKKAVALAIKLSLIHI